MAKMTFHVKNNPKKYSTLFTVEETVAGELFYNAANERVLEIDQIESIPFAMEPE